MKTTRTLIALAAAVALVSVLAVVALAAPSQAHRGAATAEYCQPAEKQARKDAVKAFTAAVHARNKARAAYFKTHKSGKQRAAYVKATNKLVAQLAKAKKKLAACG